MVFNSRLYLPIATAAAGFGLAWLVKPVPEQAASAPVSADQPSARRPASSRDGGRPHLDRNPAAPANASPDSPADPGAVARMERAYQMRNAIDQRERGKLVRLSEAIGLSQEQVDRFEALITAQRQDQKPPGFAPPKETLDQAIAAARAFDAKFQAMLTPEQVLALGGYRARQQENRTEALAQRALTDVIERIDVTADQRADMLDALRESAAKEETRLPEGLNLLLDSNPTAISGGTFSPQSLETLTVLSQDPDGAKDPLAIGRIMQQHQQDQLTQRANALTGILTPAQLNQYRAAVNSQITFGAPQR